MAALKTEAVQARIDHYVKSKHPQAHHEELRNLLPRLEEAILQYRQAKNKRSKATRLQK